MQREQRLPLAERGTAAATHVSRRDFLRTAGAVGLLGGISQILPAYARPSLDPHRPAAPGVAPRRTGSLVEYDLTVAETPFRVAGRRTTASTLNATVPGPLLRFREGDEAVIRGPGEVFEYRFPIRQYGTHWYHSHSAFQEQTGHYGPMILDPADGYPYAFDREYVVMLGDWTFENPAKVLDRLKKQPDYYNYQKRTVFDFFRDVARDGLGATLRDRRMWGEMRMSPTDISDITGATYTYLVNGLAPETNWTGLFRPGERVLLRFINAAAATYFDVRLPGLPLQVVQVSGQFVEPVETDEFRIAIAETYDVIVEPTEDRAYTIFAEAMDRSGYARGTLAPREGMSAPIPERRKRPILSMADMGMAHGDMEGMEMPGMDHGSMPGMTTPADTAQPAATRWCARVIP